MKIISISDVITNSSSEVFVIHGKPEFQEELNQEIPEFLKDICELAGEYIYNIMDFSTADSNHVDQEWYYYVHKGDLIINSIDDNSIPEWLMEIISNLCDIAKFKNKFFGYIAEDLGRKITPYYDWNYKDGEDPVKYKETSIPSIQRKHLG